MTLASAPQIGEAALCRCDKYTSDNWQLVIPHGASTAYWVQNGRRRALRKLRARSDPGTKQAGCGPLSPGSSAVSDGNSPQSPRQCDSDAQRTFRAPRSPARAIPAPSPRRSVARKHGAGIASSVRRAVPKFDVAAADDSEHSPAQAAAVVVGAVPSRSYMASYFAGERAEALGGGVDDR